MTRRKRVTVFLHPVIYNLVKQSARRQRISLAEYGSLAFSWYFSNSEIRRKAARNGYRGWPRQKKTY
jgi:hypothetical protein